MRMTRLLACVVMGTCAVALTLPATADTVYLKNGRKIDSSSVQVDGQRVIVRIYGGEVSFPMSVVDRIEQNTAVEPSTRPAPAPVAPDLEEAQQQSGPDAASGPGAAGDPGAGEETAEEPPPTPPEQTREYWQGLLRPLQQDIDRMDRELAGLRSRTGADVQAQIDRLEERRARVQGEIDVIVRDARRQGIPAGWLRLR